MAAIIFLYVLWGAAAIGMSVVAGVIVRRER